MRVVGFCLWVLLESISVFRRCPSVVDNCCYLSANGRAVVKGPHSACNPVRLVYLAVNGCAFAGHSVALVGDGLLVSR